MMDVSLSFSRFAQPLVYKGTSLQLVRIDSY